VGELRTLSPCRRGEENFCYYISRLIGAGLGFDGGLAEYVVVEARFAVPAGDFDPVLAASLTDASLTTYTAIKPALPSLALGSTAVVIGVGGATPFHGFSRCAAWPGCGTPGLRRPGSARVGSNLRVNANACRAPATSPLRVKASPKL
jgi:hypothetical protein